MTGEAVGPVGEFFDQLHAEKYRGKGEDFREAMSRIAGALTDNENEFHIYRDMLLEQRFLPAGRIQAAVGATKNVTAVNCFVSNTIEDSFVTGENSIMEIAKQAATTMRMGGGIGYDFSTLRPSGDKIAGVDGVTGGPIDFMYIFDAICQATSSSGNRRGAQMGVLRVDHPDIERFITEKHDLTKLTGFNVSVGITDEFMRAVEAGDFFALRFGGKTYRNIDARALWDKIMRSTWDYAEPGVLFLDAINGMNNLHYCETIAASNPCGEQVLNPGGMCLLSSFNLTKYIKDNNGKWIFDWDQYKADIPLAVKMTDRIIDITQFPLPVQEKEAFAKRRMGLGVTGLANAGEALGNPYGSEGFMKFARKAMTILRDEAYLASIELAKTLGSFPAFDKEKYLESKFIKTLPKHIQEAIAEHGIHNSHLLSYAPTGTISLVANNVSSGIEPVFELESDRLVNMLDGQQTVKVYDYGKAAFGVEGKTTKECSIDDHLNVLILASSLCDSAVSKTCNVDKSMSWEDFKNIYMRAWKAGCKGCTTFNIDGKRMGILRAKAEESTGGACTLDPKTGEKSCSG